MISDSIIEDMAQRLFADSFPREVLLRASRGEWLGVEWERIEESGFTMALVDEAFGGFGVEREEAISIVRLAGQYAVPLPLAETMLANFLLGRCGLSPTPGAVALSTSRRCRPLALEITSNGRRVTGLVPSVTWPNDIAGLVAIATTGGGEAFLVSVPRSGFTVIETLQGIHHHPLATVQVDIEVTDQTCAPLPDGMDGETITRLGAALRSAAIAGSMQRILDMVVTYTADRTQFGRPLSKFQVIQHQLATIAAQTAAAASCADMIAEAFSEHLDPALIAVTKARTGEASGIVASLSHQLHGAIGVTQEYELHYFTNQLWQWRDEFGNETYWQEALARQALGDRDGLWPFITRIGA